MLEKLQSLVFYVYFLHENLAKPLNRSWPYQHQNPISFAIGIDVILELVGFKTWPFQNCPSHIMCIYYFNSSIL